MTEQSPEYREWLELVRRKYACREAIDEHRKIVLKKQILSVDSETYEAYIERMQAASDCYQSVLRELPEDYEPFGQVVRWVDPKQDYPDCACGCRWYRPMEDEPLDWGVCCNPRSHRAGLLTFEHQGCLAFEGEREEAVR